jgi:hypothetical protein
MRKLAVVMTVTLAAISCSPIPQRFALIEPRTSPHQAICGYDVSAETAGTFDLEIIWKGSAWNPDPALRKARECYGRAAMRVGVQNRRPIVAPTVADMASNVTPGNNGWVVYVTGRIRYAD